MMIPLLIAAAKWFVGSKIGRLVLLIAASLIAFGAYTAYAEHRGYVRALVAEKAATERESQRRMAALEAAQREAEQAVVQMTEMKNHNADLQNEIARRSAANDRKPCLDSAATGRLRQIGGRPSGRRVGDAAGPAAGRAR